MNTDDRSRREFLKKAAYVPPMLLTLKAAPSLARTGSVQGSDKPKMFVTPSGIDVLTPNDLDGGKLQRTPLTDWIRGALDRS